MKVEVKWLLRVPIWPAEQALFRTVFPGEPSQITVLSREEVVAGKVAALLDRAAPGNLFDMAELARHGAWAIPIASARQRSCWAASMSMTSARGSLGNTWRGSPKG